MSGAGQAGDPPPGRGARRDGSARCLAPALVLVAAVADNGVIGQAGALLLGQGSLNQPLSESDLMRERVSNNLGEASDEQISRMAITSRIVVTVSAGTPIYVVLEQTPKADTSSGRSDGRGSHSLTTNTEELRQLLQLKRELNQSSGTPQ